MDSEPRPSISLFFPVYNDERTVRLVAEKALALLPKIASRYEILIINDGSTDRSGEIADELARKYACIRVFHHLRNSGYGAAVRLGLQNSLYEWICFTDGDNEYDVYDFEKLVRLRHFYDLIITFRYAKIYSGYRQFISWGYNFLFRRMFSMTSRDISTGMRMIRRSLLEVLELESDSPFIGAEITVKATVQGYRIGEVGIRTFPRRFGKGTSTSWRNIVATFKDMLRIHRKIFSPGYQPTRDMPKEQ